MGASCNQEHPGGTNVNQARLEQIEAEEEYAIRNVARLHAEAMTYGDRVADRMAQVAGSWGFIIGFGVVLAGWIALNAVWLGQARAFDPYPFILLNLVLSCLAAIQAPVILMSQNRQATRDRLHDEQDYQVNLKAEREVAEIQEALEGLREAEVLKLVHLHQHEIGMLEKILARLPEEARDASR
jgi:uncharacterized membrane protein